MTLEKKTRAGTLIVVLIALLVMSLIASYSLKRSQSDIEKSAMSSVEKKNRVLLLSRLDEVNARLTRIVSDCMDTQTGVDLFGPDSGNDCVLKSPTPFGELPEYEQIKVVCGGERYGGTTFQECTTDQERLPKQLGVSISWNKDGQHLNLRAFIEVGPPQLADFSMYYSAIGNGFQDGNSDAVDILRLAQGNYGRLGLFWDSRFVDADGDLNIASQYPHLEFMGGTSMEGLYTNLGVSHSYDEDGNQRSDCLTHSPPPVGCRPSVTVGEGVTGTIETIRNPLYNSSSLGESVNFQLQDRLDGLGVANPSPDTLDRYNRVIRVDGSGQLQASDKVRVELLPQSGGTCKLIVRTSAPRSYDTADAGPTTRPDGP